MNEALNNLPSVGQMFKLVVVLLMAVVAMALVVAIVKMLLPLAFLGLLVAGVYWFFLRSQDKAKRG